MKVKSFQEPKDIRQRLAAKQAHAAQQAAERAARQQAEQQQHQFFARAVEPVRTLVAPSHGRVD